MSQPIEIINVFYTEPTKVYTIHEISKMLSMPYGTTYNYVQSMIKDKILRSSTKGKATLCSFNFESQKAVGLLSSVSLAEKEEYVEKEGILSNAIDSLLQKIKHKSNYNLLSLILFGSSVKGTARKNSDIDLFIIIPLKEKYDDMVERECNVLRMSYDREINPITVEPKMYIDMLKEKEENVAKQVLRDKVIFFGANKFWELTMEALR